ncbi:MAG: glycosyltransferase family 8 protein [Alphaproteobacteria bacterium]|nr:glycosyltransferase family 8 protein [Alphaproteobacteria bacterium]
MNSKKMCMLIVLLMLGIIAASIFLYQEIAQNQSVTEPEIKKTETPRPEKIRIQPNTCQDKPASVDIVYITDSRYTPPTMVSMSSAIKNKCQNTTYNFYIIAQNLTPQDEQALNRLKNLAPETVNIQIIPQTEPDLPYENMQRFLQYKVGMHKIYLPQVLKNLNKVIYMDGDTLVLKDLRPLFEQETTGVYALAAKDGIFYRFPNEMAEIGLDKRGFYFNSGVMLYNLALQRQENVVEKLVEYIKTHTDFFGDQDVLNVVFADKVKLMSYKYNCISTFFEADDLDFLSTYFGEPLSKDTFYIYENASIIHYAGDKPWQDNYKPSFLKELWFRYYDEIKDY